MTKVYNPMTDFICYPRATYGNEIFSCYKDKHNPELNKCFSCHEDRKITGTSVEGCTPSADTSSRRLK